MVLVTPHIVEPSDVKPMLPTGDPATWGWDSQMYPDTTQQGR
jgi:hypothetical protein